jgi:hypothetical protein
MEQLRFGKIQSKSSLKFDKTSDQLHNLSYNAIKRVQAAQPPSNRWEVTVG